jgi:hypothetical protein
MSAVLSSASSSVASVGQTRAQSNKAAAPKKVSPLSFGMVTKVKDGGEYLLRSKELQEDLNFR